MNNYPDISGEAPKMCQVKIKDNHNAFYYGAAEKRACLKQAVKIIDGTHMCQHHYNKAIKRKQNNPLFLSCIYYKIIITI